MRSAVEAGGRGPFVLLHAAGAGPRSLACLAAHLGTAAGDVRMPALPMDIDAEAARAGRPLAAHVGIVRHALGEAGDAPLVVGHSFGGVVALLALLAGARVAGAVLYEPIAFAALDPADPGDAAGRAWDRALVDALAAGSGDSEAGVVRFIEAWNEVAWGDLPPAVRDRALADAAAIAALTAAVHHLPLDHAALRRLDVPVLLLTGDRSPEVARRMAERLANLLPRAELRTVTGAGHMGPVKAPERVASMIDDWMGARFTGI